MGAAHELATFAKLFTFCKIWPKKFSFAQNLQVIVNFQLIFWPGKSNLRYKG